MGNNINNTIKHPPKPQILTVKKVASSRLFTIEAVELMFSNGAQRIYERMRPAFRQSVMIVPVYGDELLLIREYAVGMESYELGFPKGLIDPGESVLEAANRELMEEVGFAARELTVLTKLTISPSYFSGVMHIVLARDLFPQAKEGDEPEPLVVTQWPLKNMLDLLQEPDFREARNISALFLAHRYLNHLT